jgi:hypothetical protein
MHFPLIDFIALTLCDEHRVWSSRCAVFSTLLSLLPLYVQILSSAPCSKTPLIYGHPLKWQTECCIHREQQIFLYILIFTFVGGRKWTILRFFLDLADDKTSQKKLSTVLRKFIVDTLLIPRLKLHNCICTLNVYRRYENLHTKTSPHCKQSRLFSEYQKWISLHCKGGLFIPMTAEIQRIMKAGSVTVLLRPRRTRY